MLPIKPNRLRSILAWMSFLVPLLLSGPLYAVFSGDMSPRARASDVDYAAGIDAFEEEDWPAVVANMRKVVERRPHHDNAWGRLGYAYRKLQRYDESIAAYKKSLELNPRNRASLEYLGEAYLDLGRMADAREVLGRLLKVCRNVTITFSDGDFNDGCVEYRELNDKFRD